MYGKIFVISDRFADSFTVETIIDYLQNSGYEKGENLFITKDPAWDNLDPEVKKVLSQTETVTETTKTTVEKDTPITLDTVVEWDVHDEYSNGSVYNWGTTGWSYDYHLKGTYLDYLENPYGEYNAEIHSRDGARGNNVNVSQPEIIKHIDKVVPKHYIYGIGLQGDNPYGALNIDDPNIAIKQVTDIVGVKLSLEQQFIIAYNKGSIPAVEDLARELELTDSAKKRMMQQVIQETKLPLTQHFIIAYNKGSIPAMEDLARILGMADSAKEQMIQQVIQQIKPADRQIEQDMSSNSIPIKEHDESFTEEPEAIKTGSVDKEEPKPTMVIKLQNAINTIKASMKKANDRLDDANNQISTNKQFDSIGNSRGSEKANTHIERK